MHNHTKIYKEPFLEFPKKSYTFVEEFPKDNQYGCNIHLKTEKGALELFQHIDSHKGTNFVNEIKFWFALSQESSIFAKIKGDYLKIHYDHGYQTIFDKKFNLYGSLNFKRPLNNLSWRLGAYYKNNNIKMDNRIRIQSKPDKFKYNIFWHSKAATVINKWSLGYQMSVDLVDRFITKNNVYIGYCPNDKTSIYLRG